MLAGGDLLVALSIESTTLTIEQDLQVTLDSDANDAYPVGHLDQILYPSAILAYDMIGNDAVAGSDQGDQCPMKGVHRLSRMSARGLLEATSGHCGRQHAGESIYLCMEERHGRQPL